MSTNENPNDSLTSRQIAILAGRSLAELSAYEKLDYANAAPRVVPRERCPVSDAFRFRIDVEKLAGLDPAVRLRVANGASSMEDLRQRLAALNERLQGAVNDTEGSGIRREMGMLSREAARLSAEIASFELKKSN